MKSTSKGRVVSVCYERVLIARADTPKGKPSALDQLAAVNARLNAESDRVLTAAAANTRRLTGKTSL